MFSNIDLVQFIMNACSVIRDMQAVPRKVKSAKIKRDCDKILKTALDPRQVTRTLVAIREVNASFSGKT